MPKKDLYNVIADIVLKDFDKNKLVHALYEKIFNDDPEFKELHDTASISALQPAKVKISKVPFSTAENGVGKLPPGIRKTGNKYACQIKIGNKTICGIAVDTVQEAVTMRGAMLKVKNVIKGNYENS